MRCSNSRGTRSDQRRLEWRFSNQPRSLGLTASGEWSSKLVLDTLRVRRFGDFFEAELLLELPSPALRGRGFQVEEWYNTGHLYLCSAMESAAPYPRHESELELRHERLPAYIVTSLRRVINQLT